jgi:hypothetical protein
MDEIDAPSALHRITPADLARPPFLVAEFEMPTYDPSSQTSLPLNSTQMLFTHCWTTQTFDSSGKPVDPDGQVSDD